MPVARELVTLLQAHVIPGVRNLASAVGDGIRWFNGLSDSTRNALGTLTLVAAALGPLAVGLGTAMRAVKAFKDAWLALQIVMKAMSGPRGWITLAIAALAGLALILSGKNKDQLVGAAGEARLALIGGDKYSLISALQRMAEDADG